MTPVQSQSMYDFLILTEPPDGCQPHELARTLSWNYSIFNLLAMLTAALVSKRVGVNLTDQKGDEGQESYLIPQKALMEFMNDFP